MPSWKNLLNSDPLPWLLEQEVPWVRYRAMLDLMNKTNADPEVASTREEMVNHPGVKEMIQQTSLWPGNALTRHNDAAHLIHKLTVLTDFGLSIDDPGIKMITDNILSCQSQEGAFQSLVRIPKAFGGTGEDILSWMLCDAPTVLYALIQFGLKDHPAILKASEHMASLIRENGWPCASSPEFGKFRGPGRKSDPCPYANLIAVKALIASSNNRFQEALSTGVEMLLNHWEHKGDRKIYMFGIGTTFRRLKYPLIWYDILHVLDTLSRLPAVHTDPRFKEMVEELINAQDEFGRFTAGSVWTAWKGWKFAQKREPSPWITLLTLRILKRVHP